MRTAIVSTYLPRACGIGAFAADVRSALLGLDEIDRVEKVVIVNRPSRPRRPAIVATIAQAVRGDNVRAARILGRLDVDVVLLQHECRIFGGCDGGYVASLVEELSQPLVVTLNTVLPEPTETARRLLVKGGTWADDKVRVVPHGVQPVIAQRADTYALRRATGGRASMRTKYGADGQWFLVSLLRSLASHCA